MRRLVLAAAISAIATGASAQYDPDLLAAAMQRRAAQLAAQREAQEQAAEADLRRTIGIMMADGDCVGARDVALKRGRFDLAKEVDSLCHATPESPKQ